MKMNLLPSPNVFSYLLPKRLFGCLLLWIGLLGNATAQTLDPAFHIPEIYGEANVVDAAQMPSGQYVVAGSLTRANGQASAGLARFNAAGVTDQTFRQNLSGATVQVEKVYPMANGQLLVQGDYTAGTIQRRYLFRLNADGTLDPAFNLALPGAGMLPNVMQAVVQPDGRVLVLGLYLSGNSNEFDVFRVLSNGSRDPSFAVAPTTFSQDLLMALQTDGKIVLGGSLTAVNGIRYPFFARLNTDGSTDTSYQPAAYTNARLYINSIALDANNALLVGGPGINVINGQAAPLFRMLSTGAFDPTFACPASLLGRDCSQVSVHTNGRISVLLSTYSSVTNLAYSFDKQLLQLQASGAVDASFQQGTGPDNVLIGVRSVANGTVLTWGYLNNYAGQRRTVAMLQPTGSLDAGFAPLLQNVGSIQKIVRQADGKLVVTGRFNSIDGHMTDRVARLLANGQPEASFAWRQPSSASWETTALAVQADGRVLLAGNSYSSNSFTATSTPIVPLFTRLTTTGQPDASFAPVLTANPSASSYYTTYRINLLAEQASGQLVVGGFFVDAAGKPNLTRLNANGSVDPSFTPAAAQPAIHYGVAQADGNLICVVAGVAPAPKTIQRVLSSGTPDPAFSYIPTTNAYEDLQRVAQVPSTGGYIVGGVLDRAGQVLARVSATGAAVAGFATPFQPIVSPVVPESGVNAVAVQSNGKIMVGGALRQGYPYTTPATLLARLEANGQLDPTFDPGFIAAVVANSQPLYSQYEVADVLVQPDGALVVGGYFLRAGTQPVTGLVRIMAAGALSVRPSTVARTEVWPIPAQALLNLKLDAAARPRQVTLFDALGKAVLTQPTAQSELTLDITTLARGLYVLRVDYSSGPVTRRIAIN